RTNHRPLVPRLRLGPSLAVRAAADVGAGWRGGAIAGWAVTHQAEAYPLQWPVGWKRTVRRRRSSYQQNSFAVSRDQLLRELKLMGARYVTISSNIPLRLDGLPYANTREPNDPGIAIYWEQKGQPKSIACDRWEKSWENLRACLLAIQALRQLERCGASEILERAFQGFNALPAEGETATEHWRSVLGFSPDEPVSAGAVGSRYRELARQRHPDRGGSHEAMATLNRAFAEARDELKGGGR